MSVGCSAKKLIVLPNKGDRTVVYTDSGDTLKITNKEVKLQKFPLTRNAQYQNNIGIDCNYAGALDVNNKKSKTWVRDGLSNVVIQDGILYYTNHGKVQRYDLKQKKALGTLPFVTTKPTILSVQNNCVAVVTGGIVSVYDLAKKKTVFEQPIQELITKRPLIVKGKLFVQTQADDLICFDLSSAKELWRYTHSKHSTYIFQNDRYAGLATWNNDIIFVTAVGDIVVLDMDTREPYWVYPSTSISELALNVSFTPIVKGDELYLAKKDTGLICLNLKDRSMVWYRPNIQTILQPCIYGDYIFVASGKTIIAVDRKTGNALYQTKPLPESIVSAPFVQDNHLIIISSNRIYSLSLVTGEIISEQQVTGSVQQLFPYQNGLGIIRLDQIVLS